LAKVSEDMFTVPPSAGFVNSCAADQFDVARTRKNLLPVAWLVKLNSPPFVRIGAVGSLVNAVDAKFVVLQTP